MLKELAKASGHCYCIKELEVKVSEKASEKSLPESALRTRDRTVAHGLLGGGDKGTLKTIIFMI